MARYRAASLAEVNKIINEKIMPKKLRSWTAFIWKGVVFKNPVDTYTCANSWFVTLEVPSREKPEYKNYGGFPTMPAELRGGSKFGVTLSGRLRTIYITNNQDYVGTLERGGSKRFPVPWIRPTVTQMVNAANAGSL